VVNRDYWTGIKLGLGYFTVAPIRLGDNERGDTPSALRAMVWSLPLAGVLLGLAVLGISMLFGGMGGYGAILAALIYPMLYGYLHTEAVMDVSDAWHAAHGGKDPYTVIKDPTVGAMGVLWGVGLLALKTVLTAYVLGRAYGVYWIAVPTISRTALAVLIGSIPFRSRFVERLHAAVTGRDRAVIVLIGSGVLWLLTGWQAVVLSIGGIVLAYAVAARLRSVLGFANGDVLGATLEGVEILLTAALIGWGELYGLS
jgi:adenosylcobinamide-GDP ribazoletransferase